MAAWHRHSRLPISPSACPMGGLGNVYLLYILPHLTLLAFCPFGSFLNQYSVAVLGLNLGFQLVCIKLLRITLKNA